MSDRELSVVTENEKPSSSSKAKKKKKKKNGSKSGPLSLLPPEDLAKVGTREGLLELLRQDDLSAKKVLRTYEYELELERLQIELVKLQRSVQLQQRRVCIIFEGRDAAGKGGAIRRFIEHLNPRAAR